MTSYKITGHFNVAGHIPGDIITDDDLEDSNIPALIEAGCITPVKASKPQPQEN